ncbi:MAG: DUF4097 family beta strand repeat protein, partial [Verrucomicrobia bacterium]|nr:DUF4097 family beta strand repeat protein [Verrucomicrobiota bacterium]
RLGLLVATLFVGCSPKVEGPREEAFEQTYEIDPEAGLSIRNIDGSIVIHGTETASLKLRAVKKAKSNEELKGIDITAIAEGKSASINTKFLSQKNRALYSGSRTVDYTIEVPRTVNLTRVDLDNGKVSIDGMRAGDLRATVVDGQLAVRNCCGNAHISIANGVLDLSYEPCEQRRRFSVDAQMTSGNAGIFIGRGASFHIQAETMTGNIMNLLGDIPSLNDHGTRRVDMSTGKGLVRHDITLHVTTGDIKIAEASSDTETDSGSPSQ